MDFGKTFMNWAPIGVMAGAMSLIAAQVIKLIPPVTLNMAAVEIPLRQQIQSGISPASASPIVDFFKGVLPTDIVGYLAIFISAIILVFLGRVAFEYLGTLGMKEDRVTKLVFIMAYAAIIGTLIAVLFFKIPFALGLFLADILYFGIIALLSWLVVQQIGIIKLPEN